MNLNIRNFPDDLKEKIDRATFAAKTTVRDWAIAVFQDVLGKTASIPGIHKQRDDVRERKHPSAARGNSKGGSVAKKHRSADKGKAESGARICKTHQKPMRDFGNKWLCEGPPQHSEMK